MHFNSVVIPNLIDEERNCEICVSNWQVIHMQMDSLRDKYYNKLVGISYNAVQILKSIYALVWDLSF